MLKTKKAPGLVLEAVQRFIRKVSVQSVWIQAPDEKYESILIPDGGKCQDFYFYDLAKSQKKRPSAVVIGNFTASDRGFFNFLDKFLSLIIVNSLFY